MAMAGWLPSPVVAVDAGPVPFEPTATTRVGLLPERTDDPTVAAALVARDGAAILTGCPTDETGARAVAHRVLGDRVIVVPEPAAVREGGEKDKIQLSNAEVLPVHSDGFAYGDEHCDHIFLLCVVQGARGCASFAADGHALLGELRAQEPELAAFLCDVPVDLTEPGARPATSPIALTTASGRVALRVTPYMRPAAGDPDPDRTAALLARWMQLTWDLTPLLPRFSLTPGDALCVDNYRVLHGRDPYEGERFMWRIWAWTTDGNGVPAGDLHSDSRYAFDAG
jgi:hypothetical protein